MFRVVPLLVLLAACNGGLPVDSATSVDSASTNDTAPLAAYHPVGWADVGAHGVEATDQTQDCRVCHGANLQGGTGSDVSCDSCHTLGWRTNCTFCHGGAGNNTGAPPEMLFDSPSFLAHSSHVSVGNHAAWSCDQCHKKPVDVLSEGHWFDDSPGAAEVDFSGGYSLGGSYTPTVGCSNLYCHGDGNGAFGAVNVQSGTKSCGSCHADSSQSTRWLSMSGEHARHLAEGLACSLCHADTVNEASQIVNPALHVNGQVEAQMPTGMTQSNGTCSGLCHFKIHFAKSW